MWIGKARTTSSVDSGSKDSLVIIAFLEEPQIPSWIKNNAGWWADEQIDDVVFVQGIQYLVTNWHFGGMVIHNQVNYAWISSHF
jgi:hypothetical protein